MTDLPADSAADVVPDEPPGRSLAARAMRSSAITVLGFAGGQGIRLVSNLILTRLLFPEAFGMMALVSVFLMLLAMLSDLGTGPAIMASARGDDPAFLDTAWVIQIARGATLWLTALAASPAVAAWYDEPDLRHYLPVAALTLLITAFNPTRLETANRHMRAGLVTLLDLGQQVLGVAVAVGLAWATGSVWSLVVSGIVASLAHLALLTRMLPGHRNRFAWDRTAAHELIHFGKWIFLATFCGFAIGQADKVILGRALDLDHFGLYNIAFFLASVPLMLGTMVMRRVLIPIYRDSPPAASNANRARIRHLRGGALGALLGLSALLAVGGEALVALLYDPRYHEAGRIVTLIAVVQAPALLILTCDQAALAMGDSARFFWLTAARAVLVTGGVLVGLQTGGLGGALVGQGLGNLAAYPVLVWLLRPHGAWDWRLDLGFFVGAAAVAALAVATHGSLLTLAAP